MQGGGRLFNKPWGMLRMSRTRKANRAKNMRIFNRNMSILKAAEHLEPPTPFKLYQPLPEWKRARMVKQVQQTQQLINWRSTFMSPAAGAAMQAAARDMQAHGAPQGQRERQQKRRQLPRPGHVPQARQQPVVQPP